MNLMIIYMSTLIPFLLIDIAMLRAVMLPLFERNIGSLMAEDTCRAFVMTSRPWLLSTEPFWVCWRMEPMRRPIWRPCGAGLGPALFIEKGPRCYSEPLGLVCEIFLLGRCNHRFNGHRLNACLFAAAVVPDGLYQGDTHQSHHNREG